MIYTIDADALRVMLELLEDAASTGSLSTYQLERLCHDPMDIVRDLKSADIINCSVFAHEHPPVYGAGIQPPKRTHGRDETSFRPEARP